MCFLETDEKSKKKKKVSFPLYGKQTLLWGFTACFFPTPPGARPWNAVALWSYCWEMIKRWENVSPADLYCGLVFYIVRAAWPCERICSNVLAPIWGWIQIYEDLSSSVGGCNGDLRRVNTEQTIHSKTICPCISLNIGFSSCKVKILVRLFYRF